MCFDDNCYDGGDRRELREIQNKLIELNNGLRSVTAGLVSLAGVAICSTDSLCVGDSLISGQIALLPSGPTVGQEIADMTILAIENDAWY